MREWGDEAGLHTFVLSRTKFALLGRLFAGGYRKRLQLKKWRGGEAIVLSYKEISSGRNYINENIKRIVKIMALAALVTLQFSGYAYASGVEAEFGDIV